MAQNGINLVSILINSPHGLPSCKDVASRSCIARSWTPAIYEEQKAIKIA